MNNKIKHISFLVVMFFVSFQGIAQKTKLIIDADTANEMDDLYAVTYAVIDSTIEVKGVVSSHFNNPQLLTDSIWHIYPTKEINTVKLSQDLNQKILRSLDRTEIPALIGSKGMIGYSWGYEKGDAMHESPGVDFIIEQAKKASPDDKMNIAVLGPSTNVAIAIEKSPEIIPNLRIYLLGTRYNASEKIWNKNSFNARNDINALDVLLNTKDLELWIMPITSVKKFTFDRKKTVKLLSELNSDNAKILKNRWNEISNAGDTWVMWDLALIQAISNPDTTKSVSSMTPPENSQRKVMVYTEIDEEKMRADFWELYKKVFK